MARLVTVFFYVLIICATQSGSFKIISKIKNYLLPTTTTTAAPILSEFGQNDTNQETTWGEEATEENITTTSERNPEEHVFQPGDSHSYLPKGTTTDRSVLTSDEQPVYPGMPKSSPTTSNNGDGKLISDQNSSDNAWQESTTTKGFDDIQNQPQDFLPVQNTTNGMSDNDLEGLKPSGNDGVHSSGFNIYGQSTSTNNQSGANSIGEGLYDTPNSNVNLFGGNNEGGNLYETSSSSGNHTTPKTFGKDLSGNQTYQLSGENGGGGNLYEKPNPSVTQNAEQSGGSIYGGNNQGPKEENNNTAARSHHEDSLIYPDNPLLNPTPEPARTYEVGCSRIALENNSKKVAPNSTIVGVPVDGGRVVIDAPIKDCGKGRKLNGKGECRAVARK